MAVVQISKIQIRRGLKNTFSGVPQLSSAEMAWAVDTQELFIGNGAVSEGAPYVGNTKIITEHDNLLDLANSYRFANNDISIVDSVPRGLQSKLDEYVSVKDFGAIGNGISDDTVFFQNALDSLFQNVDEKYKKTLLIPNGTYVLNSDLRIPSGAIIQGETVHGAKLQIGSNSIRLKSSDGKEFIDFSSTIRAENIKISNLTFLRTTGSYVLSGIRNSIFDSVIFKGQYELGDTVAALATEPSAIFWQNPSLGVAVDNLYFKDCTFETNSISIKVEQTGVFETNVKFTGCKFYVNHVGIFVQGVQGQSNNWTLADCQFEQTANEAVRITQGRNTLIRDTIFKDCGNNTGTAQFPVTPVVYFGEKNNNRVINCTSNRPQSAGVTDNENLASVIEIENSDKAVFVDRVYSEIFLSDSFRPLAVFSARARFIVVDYFLQLGNNVKNSRVGQLTLSLGSDLAGDNITDISITDNYQYSPNFITSSGGITMTNLEFSAELRSNSTLDDSTGPNSDTILLSYRNPLTSGSTGTIAFQITYGV